ncbi:four helix bundle protein [Vibrio brasiliensis]|uniref:four helix bundle protein n=1 Tax=Vibrio brasiliensis TaxID=170652 RepID=UPI001EFEAB20|nr:four helix bundle protein [Vibrio brasiliensis]MCG9782230.1 four helix bundle protein [Vibrio brasiliensis]
MKYEKLQVWKTSFELCKQTYLAVQGMRDYSFRDQIRRSSISIPSNIAEGVERASAKETAYFLNVAKGSVGELKTQLLLASELNYLPSEQCNDLCTVCDDISCILGALIIRHKSNI